MVPILRAVHEGKGDFRCHSLSAERVLFSPVSGFAVRYGVVQGGSFDPSKVHFDGDLLFLTVVLVDPNQGEIGDRDRGGTDDPRVSRDGDVSDGFAVR